MKKPSGINNKWSNRAQVGWIMIIFTTINIDWRFCLERKSFQVIPNSNYFVRGRVIEKLMTIKKPIERRRAVDIIRHC